MRAGYVALIGKANAGKSTLLNVLVGEKVAITSPKPQTTRNNILGILTKSDFQIVFVDTPGIYKNTTYLSSVMKKSTESAAKDVDFLLYVHDGHAPLREDDFSLMKKYTTMGIPSAIAYTKTDIMPKEKAAEDARRILEAGIDADILPVSARRYTNIAKLESYLAERMPEGEALFDDVISDRGDRFMVTEIMREKLLLKLDNEVPHGTAVVMNRMEKTASGVWDINLDIICEKPNHKAIIIGKGGQTLKEINSYARQDMEKYLGEKVFLTTFVKVEKDWRSKPKMVKDIFVE